MSKKKQKAKKKTAQKKVSVKTSDKTSAKTPQKDSTPSPKGWVPGSRVTCREHKSWTGVITESDIEAKVLFPKAPKETIDSLSRFKYVRYTRDSDGVVLGIRKDLLDLIEN